MIDTLVAMLAGLSVFVSRTSDMADFPAGRSFARAAFDATIKASGRPVEMEYFAASGVNPADYCRHLVVDCDVYVGVIGFRYGSAVPDVSPRISYTELEYDEAGRAGRPRLMFLLDEEAPIPRTLVDVDGRQIEQFRRRIRSDGVVSVFSSADGLEAAVLHALNEWMVGTGDGRETTRTRAGSSQPWMVPSLGLVVPRDELINPLVQRLTAAGGDSVGVTTGVEGAGGFGKTTLTAMACARADVRRRYPGGLVWVTVGEKAAGAELAGLVNDATEVLTATRPSASDPLVAGARLSEALEGRLDTLLVLDDVWSASQLTPFLMGGSRCRRLITTRNRGLLPLGSSSVVVDAMTRDQAADALRLGLEGVAPDLIERLSDLTGRWPVLLGLVNAMLHDRVADGASPDQAARWVAGRLSTEGPTALDVTDEQTRHRAVAATLAVSLDRLTPAEQELYRLLAIFPEDADIPVDILVMLWRSTGRLTFQDADAVRERLVRLRLVIGSWAGNGPAVRLHDVIRDYLRRQHAPADLVAAHRRLLLAARMLITENAATAVTAWWDLPPDQYLWRYLPWHLNEAGEHRELLRLLEDLRWTVAKTLFLGSVVPVEADLALVSSPAIAALRRAMAQNSHLLAPLDPGDGLGPTLASRLEPSSALRPIVTSFLGTLRRPYLQSRWRLPDLPEASTRRILSGNNCWVTACVVSPTGNLVAEAGINGGIRIWRTDTWEISAVLEGHSDAVNDCEFTPDGVRLVSVGDDGTLRLWDIRAGGHTVLMRGEFALTACAVMPDGASVVATGLDGAAVVIDLSGQRLRRIAAGHQDGATACAVSPDGRIIATGGNDRAVRLWDASTGVPRGAREHEGSGITDCAFSLDGEVLAATIDDGTCVLWELPHLEERARLTGHTASARACAFSRDSRQIVTAGYDQTIRTWSTADGSPTAVLTGHPGWARDCAFTPDGSQVVSAGGEQVRIWDLVNIDSATLGNIHRGWVRGCARSPDGVHLATGGDDRFARLWNVSTGQVVWTVDAHAGRINSCAFSSEGDMLATAGSDTVIRLWTMPAGEPDLELRGHDDAVVCCAFAPGGSRLASGSEDKTARIWNPHNGSTLLVLSGHSGPVNGCAFSPDGKILATASVDGTARLWDPGTGETKVVLLGHQEWVNVCAFTPDGRYLVTGSGDHTVRIWDAHSGRHLRTLTGHTQWVRGCAISPDGRWIATTSRDRTVRVWDFGTGQCVTALRAEARLTTCCWTSNVSIAIAGDAGVYHFTLIRDPKQSGDNGSS